MHALAEGGSAVRLPIKQAEALSRVRQKYEEIHRATGTEPTPEELARALDMHPEDIADLLRAYRPQIPLDAPLKHDGGPPPPDFLRPQSPPPREEAFFLPPMIN